MKAVKAKELTEQAKVKAHIAAEQRKVKERASENAARIQARAKANELFNIEIAGKIIFAAERGDNSISLSAEDYVPLVLDELSNVCRDNGYSANWHTSKDLDMDGGRYGEETSYLIISW